MRDTYILTNTHKTQTRNKLKFLLQQKKRHVSRLCLAVKNTKIDLLSQQLHSSRTEQNTEGQALACALAQEHRGSQQQAVSRQEHRGSQECEEQTPGG